MNKQEKSNVITRLHESFQQSSASFLINFKGLKVKQMQALRKQVRQEGGEFQVAKARLMKRAVDGVEGGHELSPFLKEQVGLIFAKENFPVIAKALHEFSKKHEMFQVVAGLLERRVYDKTAVARIAQLPPKEIILAQLCGVLKAPTRNMVGLLNMLTLRLLIVLKQAAEKKAAD